MGALCFQLIGLLFWYFLFFPYVIYQVVKFYISKPTPNYIMGIRGVLLKIVS